MKKLNGEVERERERERERKKYKENEHIHTTLGEQEIDGRLIRKF